MKNSLIFFLVTYFLSFNVQADQKLVAENIWIREAPPTVTVMAAYMTLRNQTDRDITLICAESPAFEDVMFHRTEINDGMAKMRHADKIVIPAHSSFDFAPGGFHLMLMGRKNTLREGDNVDLTLIFEQKENQEITAVVKKTMPE